MSSEASSIHFYGPKLRRTVIQQLHCSDSEAYKGHSTFPAMTRILVLILSYLLSKHQVRLKQWLENGKRLDTFRRHITRLFVLGLRAEPALEGDRSAARPSPPI